MAGMTNTRDKRLRFAWLIIAPVLLLLVMNPLRADDTPTRNIVVLGDSISSAYGLATTEGWVALLQEKLKEESFNIEVINASVTGDTTAGGLTRLPKLLKEYQPALVIIELGGNDGLRGLSIKKLKANLNEMATLSQANGADVVIVSVQLPDNYGAAYNKLFKNAFTSTADATKSYLVPFLFEGLDSSSKWFQTDGIHPSAQAQPVMLENIWQIAKEPLEKLVTQ